MKKDEKIAAIVKLYEGIPHEEALQKASAFYSNWSAYTRRMRRAYGKIKSRETCADMDRFVH